MRIGIVLGTRPEIIKNYSVVKALRSAGASVFIIHTAQHCDYRMSEAFFEDLGYSCDFLLEGCYEIGKAIDWVRRIIRRCQLDLIVVNGDTAAALVGTIAAMYSNLQIAHIEAGLRSFDAEMYEERNRIMVDACSNYLFAYTNHEKRYLESHPEIRGRIYCVGNTTVDLIKDFSEKITRPMEGRYAYITLHRKEFTDREALMREVFEAINELPQWFDACIFPVHPRTMDAIKRYRISKACLDRVTLLEPVSVFESLSYQRHAGIILTDSGCIQEEAYIFNVPCVTIRDNTERHLTVLNGANIVSGFKKQDILAAVEKQLGIERNDFPNIYGTDGVGRRIADILLSASCPPAESAPPLMDYRWDNNYPSYIEKRK